MGNHGKDLIYSTPMRIADFTFDESVASVFDDMVVRSVPFYDEIQRMVVQLASHFVQENSRVYDLGCSTGTTLVLCAKFLQKPNVRFVGIDNSQPMLEKAREKLQAHGVADLCDLIEQDLNNEVTLPNASVVIMNWALQFIRPLYRDVLIRSIYESLNNRGCLIVVEKVLGNDSTLNRLYIDLYYDFKKRKGYSELEISQKREALENVLVPYRVDENMLLLSRNGFQIVDIFFRWYNFAGFIAFKNVV